MLGLSRIFSYYLTEILTIHMISIWAIDFIQSLNQITKIKWDIFMLCSNNRGWLIVLNKFNYRTHHTADPLTFIWTLPVKIMIKHCIRHKLFFLDLKLKGVSPNYFVYKSVWILPATNSFIVFTTIVLICVDLQNFFHMHRFPIRVSLLLQNYHV